MRPIEPVGGPRREVPAVPPVRREKEDDERSEPRRRPPRPPAPKGGREPGSGEQVDVCA